MNSLYTICYISRAAESLTDMEIGKLLTRSTYTNNKNNINGILLFTGGNFLQVLEGPKGQLIQIFKKIAQDKRHDTIYEIYNGSTDYPMFLEYNSQFNLMESKTDLIALKEYLRRNRYSGVEAQVMEMLEPFLDTAELY